MLVVKVYVNETQIDELYIHNLGEVDAAGRHVYQLEKPTVPKLPLIHHWRKDGWKQLVLDVLSWMIDIESEMEENRQVPPV
jgi:hypothetical protein